MNTRTTIYASATFLFLAVFSFGQSTDTKIKTFLDNLNENEFSGTILVAHNDTIIEKRAFGFASIEYAIENKLDTKFNIASITKMITAVATLQLFENGKVELEKPIGEYLQDYPNKLVRDSVTIHQLLTHTSGNNNFYEGDFLQTDKLKYNQISDFVPLFANDSLLSKPSTKYDYSASGFVILGLIIEKVSGQNYYTYVKENIFKPAEMINTTELKLTRLSRIRQADTLHFLGRTTTRKKMTITYQKLHQQVFIIRPLKTCLNFRKP